jgi:filamentous hemagglutinin family protein
VVTEIIRDGSAGNPDTALQPVETPAGVWEIGEIHGRRVGRNIFHSFGKFNVGAGDTALFTANPVPTDNVISRVTGGASSIYGTIRSGIPGADLFLLNPSGILFGPDAQLDVRGSFHASTADSLRMRGESGEEFLAFSGESLLEMAHPLRFGFLAGNTGTIRVEGSSLQVPEGETLSLLGGMLQIAGTGVASPDRPTLSAPGGQLALVSVGGPGEIIAESFAVDRALTQTLLDIEVRDGALLSTAAARGGAVRVEGGRFVVDGATVETGSSAELGGGAVLVATSGDVVVQGGGLIETRADAGSSGGISISAGGAVEVRGEGSELRSVATGAGQSGELSVSAATVLVEDRGGIVADTEDAPGAAISIVASDSVAVSGGVPGVELSEIKTRSFGAGAGGELSVEAQSVTLSDEARILVANTGSGPGGLARVVADRIDVTGGGRVVSLATDAATGDAGALSLSADSRISIWGGTLDSENLGQARGGDIALSAPEVELDSATLLLSEASLSGEVGSLQISAGALNAEGSSLSAFGDASGDGGRIQIDASAVDLSRTAIRTGSTAGRIAIAASDVTLDQSSVSSARQVSVGDAEAPGEVLITGDSVIASENSGGTGGLAIEASRLSLSHGQIRNDSRNGPLGETSIRATGSIEVGGAGESARILHRVTGPGDQAGALRLEAEEVRVGTAGSIESFSGDGSGAELSIEVARLDVENGGTIFTESAGGRAGDLVIRAGEKVRIRGTGGSALRSETQSGEAGDIRILGRPVVRVTGSGRIDASHFGTPGDVELVVSRLVLAEGGRIEKNDKQATTGGSIRIDASQKVVLDSSDPDNPSTIAASSPLSGEPVRVSIEAGRFVMGNGRILGFGGIARAADLDVRADSVKLGSGSFVTLQSFDSPAPGGDLAIRARESIEIGGDAQITTETFGDTAAGNILLSAPEIVLAGESLVRSESFLGDGPAGSIRIGEPDRPAREIHIRGATVSTFAATGPDPGEAREGNIDIHARDQVLIEGGASLTASVGTGLGGDIDIHHPERMVMSGRSEILAETRQGTGGEIDISADLFVQSGESSISADAGVGVDGVVNIDSPELDLESGIAQLPSTYLDAAALLRPSCLARSTGEREGSFVVTRRRGLPSSPEGFLMAYDSVGEGGLALTDAEEQPPPVGSGSAGERDPVRARRARAEGASAFRGGRFEEASRHWKEASQISGAAGDAKSRSESLRALAQTQQAMGRYADSVETLRGALAAAEKSEDAAGMASTLGSLGNAQLALGQAETARDLLARGLSFAEDAGEPELAAGLLNNLGNLEAERSSFEEAIRTYQRAASLAAGAGDRVQESKALSNAGRAALDAGRPELSRDLLDRAHARASALPDDHQKITILIHVARSYQGLATAAPEHLETSLLAAHRALSAALELARSTSDQRALSYALGNLGGLYQSENRLDEALYLTRLAARAAEEADAPESLYRWHWQAGRLLWAKARPSAAIAAYRRAVDILEETRQDSLARYGSAKGYFRQAVAPVYLDLVNALLQTSGMLGEGEGSRQLLLSARATMEQFKAAELRDYFRDECVADLEAKATSLEEVAGRVAVVYPIPLPDRMELLVSLPSGLERHTVGAGAEEVRRVVSDFRRALQRRLSNAYLAPSQTLYDWLVRPYADALSEQEVETLVFVPDGPLRSVPMAALHDGEAFLLARYALATTPGLSLLDPRPLDRAGARFLLAGVSEAVQGFPPLAAVPGELRAVQQLYGGEILLDQEFQLRRIESEMAEQQPSVVHIASHALFTGDPSTSFLLTHDSRLTMDRLAGIVGSGRFRKEPLELLILSACETAAGDDRAALGLAGVAIRAGARSALGSLWSIADEATTQLVVEFYRQLKDPSVSRATALQRAQLRLLESDRFSHPFYWSPFLMISNWL